jgi:hypothetical protein
MKLKPGGQMKEQEIEIRDDRDRQIVRSIAQLPDLEAPTDLVNSVMQALKPKRHPWWRRAYLWAKVPRAITITPLRAIPAGVAIAAIFALAIVLISPNNDRPNVQVQDTKQLPVVFTLKVPGASSVAVIGTFNQWNAKGFEMKGDKERGVWSITLSLPQGRHEYAFLVDGKKVITDPQAAFYEEDGFGSQNSVLVLRGENGQNI